MFVTVGDGETILTSEDGVTWTPRNSTTDNRLYAVTFGDGIFAAVGYHGTLLTSQDGVTWVHRNLGTNHTLYGIAYGYGTFVAVGENDTILQSDPIVNVNEFIYNPLIPQGSSKGLVGTSYTYSTSGSSSSLDHPIEYRFNWGDGTYSDWSSSGSASKAWSSPGNYTVKAQSRCATDTSIVTHWSPGLLVAVQCNYSISPPSVAIGLEGGSGSVSVTTEANCPWTASTNSGSWDWLGINSGSSGTGNGNVNWYAFYNNQTSSRSEYLTIAGQTFTVTQSGVGPDLTGLWTIPLTQTCRTLGKNQRCSVERNLTVKNIGNMDASSTSARFYLQTTAPMKRETLCSSQWLQASSSRERVRQFH